MEAIKKLLPSDEDLRDALVKYMIANDSSVLMASKDIGVAYRTLRNFLDDKRKTSLVTQIILAKFLGFDVTKKLK